MWKEWLCGKKKKADCNSYCKCEDETQKLK